MHRRLVAVVAALAATLVTALGAGAHAAEPEHLDPPALSGFSPSSTSWTSATTGWVLGWVPCGGQLCSRLQHTDDAGATWSQRTAPPVQPSEVGFQTRVFFAERSGRSTGLATNGQRLYVTYDGARTWRRLDLPGADIVGGIGANDRSVFVVGHAETGGAVSTQAFSSPIHHPRWHRLRGVADTGPGSLYSTMSVVTGSGRAVQIATSTYDGIVRLWTALNGRRFEAAYPCNPRSVMHPAIGAGRQQFVLCSSNPGRGRMGKVLRTGSAADRFTAIAGWPPIDGITSDFAVSPSSAIAVGATMASAALVHMSFDGGGTWKTTLVAPETGPVRDLSFQDARHGVLLAGHGAIGWSTVYRTTDGGHTWTPLNL